jgi:hypothetical protein
MRPLMAAALGTVALAACTSLAGVELTGVRRFTPLPAYSDWWTETEACSGRAADFGRIEWWEAETITVNKQIVLAHWEKPHKITLTRFHVATASVVRHEMLHDLLDGDPNHADEAWQACGVSGVNG